MRTKWQTNLTKLLTEHSYLGKDEILLVKLVTFTRIASSGLKYESDTKVCPATFQNCGDFIRWRIHDTTDDSLIIRTPVKIKSGLGYTNFENVDDIDSIYIITAYRIVQKEQLKQKYMVYARYTVNGKRAAQRISAETLTEARTIVAALEANGMLAEIIEC